jgi:hypothetical protein
MRLMIVGPIALLLAAVELHIPNRASTPLFKGTQGTQRTEIRYDPAAGTGTMKVLVQDPNGYFVPNIRPENFAVYDSSRCG